MAKAISDDELQLKKRARRRLVGAIALVLLVVVFLPMFLDSEPRPLNQDIAISIPPVPDSAPTPAMPEAGAEPAHARTDAPPPVAGMPQQRPAEAPIAPPASSEGKAPEASSPAPTTAPREARPAAQAAPSDGFVVQLGAFSNAANAKALQKKLQENKFKAYTELVKVGESERTRVRVGPYSSRGAAEKAREQLRSRKLIIGDATVVRQGE